MNKKQKQLFLSILHDVSDGEYTNESILLALEEYLDGEKQKLIKDPKYTPADGFKAVYFLKESGFHNAKLIGSLSRSQNSNTDIDILIPDKNDDTEYQLIAALKPLGDPVRTDWGGLYFYDTIFGDIDIFFTTKDFNF